MTMVCCGDYLISDLDFSVVFDKVYHSPRNVMFTWFQRLEAFLIFPLTLGTFLKRSLSSSLLWWPKKSLGFCDLGLHTQILFFSLYTFPQVALHWSALNVMNEDDPKFLVPDSSSQFCHVHLTVDLVSSLGCLMIITNTARVRSNPQHLPYPDIFLFWSSQPEQWTLLNNHCSW